MAKKDARFRFHGWDADPIGTYAQPMDNTDAPGAQEDTGYPQTDIDMDNIWVKGKYPPGTKKKTRAMMRGYGAATKGRKFYSGKD